MKSIILPGYSASNKEWAEEVAKDLGSIVHYWKHWSQGSLSVKYEVEKIIEEIGENEIGILAKSVGTMVAMHVISKISWKVQKVILCGIPSVSKERLVLFKKSLEGIPAKNITVFQNEKDPLANYEEVKEFMAKVDREIKVFKMPRVDHNYPYVNEFRTILKQ